MTFMSRDAFLSDDRRYRYRLDRLWDVGLPRLGWVMLNPSTADAELDDPTIRRCIGFARDLGYGSIRVANLFALRATDPKSLLNEADPVGPRNREFIERMKVDCPMVIAGWGTWGSHPKLREQHYVAMELLPDLMCLGKTKNHDPRHPLYLPATSRPTKLFRVDL